MGLLMSIWSIHRLHISMLLSYRTQR